MSVRTLRVVLPCLAALVALLAPAPAQADDPVFERAFGAGPADLCSTNCRTAANGSAAGQLSFPAAAAVSGGEVYVADQANHRISVFSTAGAFARAFGKNVNMSGGNPDVCSSATACRAGAPGSAAGQLNNPYGVSVSSGEVYVADASNNRVSVYSTGGVFLRAFGKAVNPLSGNPDVCTSATTCRAGSSGSAAGQLSFPLGVAVSGSEVFVADTSNNRVSVFTTAGSFARVFGATGSGAGQLAFPFGIAAADGEVYVADQNNHRVTAFAVDGTFARAFGKAVNPTATGNPDVCTTATTCRIGAQGATAGQLKTPIGVAAAGGEVFVGDANHRISAYAADGTFSRAFAKGVNGGSGDPDICTTTCQTAVAGGAAGQLNGPGGMAVAGGEIFVADRSNYRIGVYATAGTFARAFGKSVWGASPFVCTASTGCAAGAAGGSAGQLNLPPALTAADGEVYVADQSNHRISVYSTAGVFARAFGRAVNAGTGSPDVCTATTTCRAGTSGTAAGQLGMPAAVAVSGGEVFVADQNNHRISVFATDGTFLRAFGKGVNPTTTGDPDVCTAATTCQSGSLGGAAGQLDNPAAVAVSGGELFVTDQGNRRVSVFATGGAFARAFGKGVNPSTGNPDICTAATTCRFGSQGAAAGQLSSPWGLTIAGGEVYVADYLNHRVSVFATGGTFARAFGKAVNPSTGDPDVCTAVTTCRAGSQGGAAGQITYPSGVAVGDGAVYVSERFNARLSVFGTDGLFQRAFGKGVNAGSGSPDVCTAITTCRAAAQGDAAGQLMEPLGLAMVGTTVYVAERLNHRVSVFGVPRTEITPAPTALAFGPRDIDDGPTAIQSSTITNTGTEVVTLSGLSLAGDAAHFARLTGAAGDCAAGATLLPGETCAVRARFDPSSTGPKTATLTVASNAPSVTVTLSGSATQTEARATPTSLAFGTRDVDDGPTALQSATIANTGTETISLSALTLTGDGAHFERLTDSSADCTAVTTLAAGASCTVRFRFDPSTGGAKAATLTVSSNTAPLTVALSGSGIQTELSATPSELDFGVREVAAGPTSEEAITVTNSGTEPVTLTSLTLSGDTSQFARLTGAAGDCAAGATLGGGASCSVRLRFDPTSTGAKSATLTIPSNAATVAIPLTGSGTRTELSRTPSTLAFGARDLDVGPSAVLVSTIANIGSETVTLTDLTLAGDTAEFLWLTDTATDCTDATELAPGATCTLRFRFDPATTGSKSATVTATSNAASVTVALTGTGVHAELSRSPTSLAFGSRDVDTGATAIQTSTIVNTGLDPVTLTALTLSGDAAHFTRVSGAAGDCTTATQLADGESCELRLRFDPDTKGAKSATLTVTSNAPPLTVALGGSGIQTRLSSSPPSLSLGIHHLDAPPAHQSATIANTGTEPVRITGLTVSGDTAHFGSGGGASGDCRVDTRLDAGQTCTTRLRFDPTTTGPKSGTLTVRSNAPALTIRLDGSGTTSLFDTDGDGIPDADDLDDDNDGVPDDRDAFPFDPTRHLAATDPPPPPAAPVTPAARPEARPWRLKRRARPRVVRTKRGALRVVSGYVAVCPKVGDECTGVATLKLRRRSTRTKKLIPIFLNVKARRITLAPGKRRRLTLRLNERGQALLLRNASLRVVLRGSMRNGAGRVVRRRKLRLSAASL